ncbi:MAG: septum formation initiator family protein [Dorea sp.]|nr:septum formation initiator family protein [Dorea sp.]
MGSKKAEKKKKSGSAIMSHHKKSLTLTFVALLLLIVVVGYSTVKLKQREAAYHAQQVEIEKQLEEEHKRTEQIEQEEAHMQEDEFIEDVARDRLGLVYPDEIIFKTQ